MRISARPPAGACAVELKASPHAPVGAHRVLHGLILLHRGFRQLLTQHKHRFQRFRRGFEQLDHLLLAQRIGFQPVICQPAFHLLDGVGIVQHGQLLQFSSQLLPGLFIHGDGVFHQRPVQRDAPVVDLLIEVILLPHLVRHRVIPQALLNAHLCFHIAQVVGFEGGPPVRSVCREMTRAILGRNTEILDQILALGQLLLVQPQRRSGILQGQRQAEIGRPDHRAVPARRVKVGHAGVLRNGVVLVVQGVAVAAQPLGQAYPFKGCVEGPLLHTLVRQRFNDRRRERFALCQVDHLHGTAVDAVRKQQNGKVRAFHVAIHRGFAQVNA